VSMNLNWTAAGFFLIALVLLALGPAINRRVAELNEAWGLRYPRVVYTISTAFVVMACIVLGGLILFRVI
jgi:hypothetical protein